MNDAWLMIAGGALVLVGVLAGGFLVSFGQQAAKAGDE